MTNTNDFSKERTPSLDPIADAWLAFVLAPDETFTQNRFASELNSLLRCFLRLGSLSGALKGMEEDVWQEANLMLHTRLLAGNQQLLAATRKGDPAMIAGQLRRSASAALRFARLRLLRDRPREVGQLHPEKDQGETVGYQHPANVTALRELPLDLQRQVVMDMLRKAVRELHLIPDNVELAHALLENNLTQADLAKSLGVSRQAVNQRLNPVWRYLRNAIRDEEFPLS